MPPLEGRPARLQPVDTRGRTDNSRSLLTDRQLHRWRDPSHVLCSFTDSRFILTETQPLFPGGVQDSQAPASARSRILWAGRAPGMTAPLCARQTAWRRRFVSFSPFVSLCSVL